MTGSTTIHLEQVGLLSGVGRRYHDTATDNVGAAAQHLGRMEGAESGFRGAAGATFQAVAQQSATAHAALARQIAEQARRAVLAERATVAGDDDGQTQEQRALAAAHDATALIRRPVNVGGAA